MTNRPLKIGIDCRMFSSTYTGIGRYTFELVQNLLQIDHHNYYTLFFNEPEFSQFHPQPSHNQNAKKVLVNAKHYSLAEQKHFLKILNQEKLDLMHFTHFNAPLLYSRPSIVTIHDLTLHFFPGKKMNSFLHRRAYYLTIKNIVKKSKKIITVSNNTKNDLQQILKVPSSKIEVIYLGVNPAFHPQKNLQKVETALKKFSITKPFLLYTGVWRDHKNVQGLLKSFHILKSQYQQNLQLVITGRPDPVYAPAIYKLTEELQIKNDLVFPGHISEEELIILMSNAAVYVFPSFYEGFGLPPLEAMQCETPVAASNRSSIPEICGKENALFFDPYSPEDMAEKIQQILTNPRLKNQLIDNGLKHLKNFSWSKMAEKTLKIYGQILSKTG